MGTVVDVVNVNTTEELPQNTSETGEEANAKPEDVIGGGENKTEETEESAGAEKSKSDLAQPGDSTPLVPDQTPAGEMPENGGEVKEDKCADLVEQSDNQNKPETSLTITESQEVSTEET